jgi:tetratricopeptide (TPR) repeat protein
MQNEELQQEIYIDPVKAVILDLIKNYQRNLAWDLIDYYFKKATTLDNFDTLGYVSLKAEKRDTYLKCAEFVYSLAKTPDQLFLARSNLYKAYNVMNRPEDALFYIEQNLSIDPENFELQCQKAFNISLMGNKQKAEEMLIDLLKKYPENAEKLKSAFSGKHLREGRTSEGILSFVESFKPKNSFFETKLKMKRWTGTIAPGQILYVDIEGGIGDQIINIRFFEKISSYGMTPILVSQNSEYYRDINQLFIRHGYNVLTDNICIDQTQKWAPMMSLPGYLGLSESQLWNKPYITPLRNPKNKLEGNKFKIGIKCSGNPYFAQDEYRKIPLDLMLNNLPKNIDIYYIDTYNKKSEDSRFTCLSDRINSWEDTLDFVDQMDCIVSSCTSLVHAAGAMGKTTFVVVPIAEYYIWTTTKQDGSSPWYGNNFYVARQTKLRDWSEPLADINQRVCSLLGTNNE